MDKYQLTDKGKEAARRHKSSPKGRATLDRYQTSDKGKESIRKYREMNSLWIRIVSMLYTKQTRFGYKVEVTADELYNKFKDVTTCYICGCELNRNYGNGTAFDNTRSFDRIDNSDIITLDNMGVSCYACNVMKQHRSLNEYLIYLDKIRNNNFNIVKYNPELSLDHLIDKSYPITDVRRYYARNWAKHILRTHKQSGYNVNITTNELLNLYVQTPNCPICGCKLEHGIGKLHNQSPTMDRINNGIHLNIDDVWVICHKCNATKRTLPLQQFKEYAGKICKRFNHPASPTTHPV
jgi:hypothetical protein